MEVVKQWDITNTGGDDFGLRADITISCDAVIIDGKFNNGAWSYRDTLRARDGDYNGEGGEYVGIGTVTAWVRPEWYPSDSGESTKCWAREDVVASGVEIESYCGDQQSPGMAVSVRTGGDSCTITNTLFFEGVPTLSQ